MGLMGRDPLGRVGGGEGEAGGLSQSQAASDRERWSVLQQPRGPHGPSPLQVPKPRPDPVGTCSDLLLSFPTVLHTAV